MCFSIDSKFDVSRTFIFCFPSTAAAILADFGAHGWEFFAAVKSEYSISRALLVEVNPKLAES